MLLSVIAGQTPALRQTTAPGDADESARSTLAPGLSFRLHLTPLGVGAPTCEAAPSRAAETTTVGVEPADAEPTCGSDSEAPRAATAPTASSAVRMNQIRRIIPESRREESNLGPLHYKRSAQPAELRRRDVLVAHLSTRLRVTIYL